MTNIDSNCAVNGYYPGLDGSSYYVQGRVTCYNATEMYLQVCANVANGSSWYIVTGSCVPADGNSFEAIYGTTTQYDPNYGKWELGVCGHVYRSDARGSDSANYPTYIPHDYSRSETQCS